VGLTQYYTATTLDGFIADPDNSLEWLFTRAQDERGPLNYGDFIAEVGALAMGSTTYEWILDHEFAGKDPTEWKWPYEVPCWVFTHRELTLVPNALVEFTSADVTAVHAEMAEAAGGRNVWIVGGRPRGPVRGRRAAGRGARLDRAGHARCRRAAAAAPDRAAAGGAGAKRRLRERPLLRRPRGRGGPAHQLKPGV
jgi:dihydrofolate reductase